MRSFFKWHVLGAAALMVGALTACGNADSIKVPPLGDEAGHRDVEQQLGAIENINDNTGVVTYERSKFRAYGRWLEWEKRIAAREAADYTPNDRYPRTVGEALDQYRRADAVVRKLESQFSARNASIDEREAAWIALDRQYGFERKPSPVYSMDVADPIIPVKIEPTIGSVQ